MSKIHKCLLVVIWIAGGSPALFFIGFEPQTLRLYILTKKVINTMLITFVKS